MCIQLGGQFPINYFYKNLQNKLILPWDFFNENLQVKNMETELNNLSVKRWSPLLRTNA